MVLTQLESDLIGDLAQDDHCLFEVFAFARIHVGEDPVAIRRAGRELLASWIARGWLEVVDGPPFDGENTAASDISEVLGLVDRADISAQGFRGYDTWLRLTDQAYADVPWLAGAK